VASREFDAECMLQVARMLGEVGADLDSAGETAPDKVDAGPYAAAIAGLAKVVLDNSSELVARLYVAGAVAAQATANAALTEAANAAESDRIRHVMGGD
jgi:hypothetical protein